MYQLRVVHSSKDVADFHAVPKLVYKNDKNYIFPIQKDVENTFSPEKNENFEKGEVIRFNLYDDAGSTIGRIASFYTKDAKGKLNGGCGFFECIDDTAAAHALFDACKEWLQLKNVGFMDGPINFGGRESFWGLLISSNSYPSYRENYHPAYYQNLFASYGFELEIEQSTFTINHLTFNKPRFDILASRIMNNPKFRFEYLDYSRLDDFAAYFVEIYNKAWSFHDDFTPMTADKMRKELKEYKAAMPGHLAIFAFIDDKPAAFYINILEINQVFKNFKGKLSLWNKIQFLLKRRTIDKVRGIIFGIIPEAQRTGIEVGMIMKMYDTMVENPQYKLAELSWIGDFNPKMFGLLEKIGAEKSKVHHTLRKVF
jgi:hypothetical protein